MRNGSNHITTLVLGHKDDNAILEPSALVVRCALVNKLYYTSVSCELVSCLQDTDKFVDTIHNDTNDPWTARHQLKLGFNRILVETLFCRQYRELNATPRGLSISLWKDEGGTPYFWSWARLPVSASPKLKPLLGISSCAKRFELTSQRCP